MKKLIKISVLFIIGVALQGAFADKKPNFIIFLVDDLGYNDLSCYGSENVKTPNLDAMAKNGIQFTSGYVGAPVCGPSRSALMTGSYPIRIGEPKNLKGLHTEAHTKELFIPEYLKECGYTTALFGKWHMGYKDNNTPLEQGFDEYYGTIAHNGTQKTINSNRSKMEIWEGMKKIDMDITQEVMSSRTKVYTEKSVDFIKRNKDKPFFLFLSHNMTHVVLGCDEAFRGKSGKGLFYDCVMELDWSMGEIRKTLKEEGIADNTVIAFLSDNGPWVESHLEDPEGNHYGSAAPLRGVKMMPWEGGHRVPYIIEYPSKIPAGQVCDEIALSMDLYATFAKLADAKLPADLKIDGKDLMPLATGETKTSPHEYYYYYCYTRLFAIRDANWKLVLPREAKPSFMGWWARMIEEVKEIELYDLKNDISETTNVAKEHPEVVESLLKGIENVRKTLGDYNIIGSEVRNHDADFPIENRTKNYTASLLKAAKLKADGKTQADLEAEAKANAKAKAKAKAKARLEAEAKAEAEAQ